MSAPLSETSATARSFAEQFRGVHPQGIDRTLGNIAADVYSNVGTYVDGWSPLTAEQLARSNIRSTWLEDERAGFRARIYTDQQGHYILAFCGSNEGKDWPHNLRQGIGLSDKQYKLAAALTQKASEVFGQNLVITGHSLGGGLAAAGAIATDTPAVTFNAAGLHDNTIERLGFNPKPLRAELEDNGLIRRYAVDHEILTSLQERNLLTRGLLPDAVGHKIELPDPEPLKGLRRFIPGNALLHGLELHGMDSVLKAQELAANASMTNPAHPANGMFNDALRSLRAIDHLDLGFSSEQQYANAAGSLAARADEIGMQRIDHVVLVGNGMLFAVEGHIDDATHRIAGIDKFDAAAQTLEVSSRQLQTEQDPLQGAVQQQRRAVLTP